MAESIADRAARIAERTRPTPAPVRPNLAPTGKQVRITTDLPQETYQSLTGYCLQAAAAAGVARVPHSVVVRTLIQRLGVDPKLAAQITADLSG